MAEAEQERRPYIRNSEFSLLARTIFGKVALWDQKLGRQVNALISTGWLLSEESGTLQ